ncbi:hypothetical protein COCC4DRAFT_56486 [Bipolaris maydis ATCC 48331]|uniref:Nephrocystin 3-like N-terminal domain-containing protein n=2 Tax=Cochliobolus heterostrophus TaxID=5016 RepID=M2U706_COCH5|nr:uncharacterized protein COCC4DRAFT_56486 [Bipolaris maydis ATCC 48331]EMD89536.1 hypothetical protein COCHEDRAFT_1156585 [Bipolaris maydis C5]KAJ6207387.1 ankyrin repeat-containing domain protein [Bipolaris maydis]ENI10249.1 hypothetical protein COCC4DRAFT_56486 [Bipolaris maydis ATCC 48331]KAJ6269948.1 ankyrin repeat-containing domain protein [Bipolaris maydis]KAJ6280243.1 ankyrin repeat-containing domain protein [Bipolaris maydis]
MLSIFLAEQLKQELSNGKTKQVVYFFCIHKKRNEGTGLLRRLLYQIIDKQPELAKHAFPYLEMSERRTQTLSSLASDPTLGRLFCIVDGLDECDENTQRFLIPRFIHQPISQLSPNEPKNLVSLIIVSRELEGLESCKKVDLDKDHAFDGDGDIALFVGEKIDELFQKKKFNESFRPTVHEALLSRASGTFLWVGFAVNDLLKMRTWSQVCKQLKSLLIDLSNMYDHMVLAIPSDNRETLSLILQWVCLAQCPLKVAELAQAVGLEPTPHNICSKGIDPVPTSILLKQTTIDAISLCGQMLKVEGEEVTLIHQSVRDYLLRCNRDRNDILEFFRVRQKETHRSITRTCFDCIAQSNSRTTWMDLNDINSEYSPLLLYTTRFWNEHARLCLDAANELFHDLYSFFQTNSTASCQSGIVENVQLLIDMGADIWVKDDRGGTLLHAAVDSGSEAMIRLFLLKGLNFRAKSHVGDTLLHQFAWNIAPEDGISIFRLLIFLGVSINEKNYEGSTALHMGAQAIYPEIVQPLDEHGANLEARDTSGKIPLHCAILAHS